MISDTRALGLMITGWVAHQIWSWLMKEIKTWDEPQIYDWAQEND